MNRLNATAATSCTLAGWPVSSASVPGDGLPLEGNRSDSPGFSCGELTALEAEGSGERRIGSGMLQDTPTDTDRNSGQLTMGLAEVTSPPAPVTALLSPNLAGHNGIIAVPKRHNRRATHAAMRNHLKSV